VAWTAGAVFGLLAVNTALYVGPLADIAGGVDVSTVGSAVMAGLFYSASWAAHESAGERKDPRHAAQMAHFATARAGD
jgi:purine-cytosine permease-like protein